MYHPIIDRLKTIADLLPTAIGGEFVPSGTKQISITENGTTTENVSSYADAEITVNVQSGGIVPTGTKQISITQNGTTTEDVTQYANAEITVNVPTGSNLMNTGEFTVIGTGQTSITIQHGFSSAPFMVVVYPKNTINTSEQHVIGGATSLLTSLIENLNMPTDVLKTGWWTDRTHTNGTQELITGSAGNYIKNINSVSFDFTGSSSYPIFETTYIWKAFALG